MGDILVFDVISFKGNYHVHMINEIYVEDDVNDIIVVDQFIWETFLHPDSGHRHEFQGHVFVLYASEDTKTLEEAERLIDYMVHIGFNKSNKLIAFGGGAIQDLVSFTASIFKRGVDWVFYPTTLLAQCDSCIGSKTSINYKGYKNLLGGFHPPREIFIYPGFLDTLPDSEIKGGVGEMLHYFLLTHKISFAEVMVNDDNIRQNIMYYVNESLAIKKRMIEKDEFDQGERNLFNYGHTFGHAIESVSNYEVNHGQAVTMGMEIANRLSLKLGLISKDFYEKLNSILLKNMPDYRIDNIDKYVQALKKDKKNTSDNLTCILLTSDYGIKTEVSYEEVIKVIKGMFPKDPAHFTDFMI